jgi:D-alanine-D-alanine ligase
VRIAFTHNLQLSDSEDEAEFDTPATVAMITSSLRKLGHEVEPVEVSGPASRLVARLEALAPDLVFNTAEGTRGRFREAFFPALFDRLGLPFTGSDAYVCAVTLDKQLTKTILAEHGVPSPRGALIFQLDQAEGIDLEYPLICKPNYEGSSMGITVDSVVEDETALRAKVIELLSRFPAGVLVEEFIVGRDVVVPFLEKASPETEGVLEPTVYSFDEEVVASRKYQLYDLELKVVGFDHVHVKVPADISAEHRSRVMDLARIVFKALGIRDAGRIDFRLREDGEIYFIEVNALPSLEKGASIYDCARLAGIKEPEGVFDCMVRSAAERYGLPLRQAKARRRRLVPRVGLTFNLRRLPVGSAGTDEQAEYDSPETIGRIKEAIASYGYEVVELEATPELPAILPASQVDVVFNIAEGFEGRARESQVPALLELLGIPFTGSDATALSLALDKGLAKRLVAQAGLHTPAYVLMTTGKERLPKGLEFPVIAKPVAEGSSKGIMSTSVVASEQELRELAQKMAERYRQAVLVERYLPGREFTVALLGERRPRVLPPMEVVFTNPDDKYPTYTFTSKFDGAAVRLDVPAKVDKRLQKEIERVARGVFTVLGCRDLARVDLRLDRDNKLHFIECNPLPGLTPGFSDFCVIAERAGIDYRTLIGEIMAPALRRWRERRKQRMLGARNG